MRLGAGLVAREHGFYEISSLVQLLPGHTTGIAIVRLSTKHTPSDDQLQMCLHPSSPDQTGQVTPPLICQYRRLRDKELGCCHRVIQRVVLGIHR